MKRRSRSVRLIIFCFVTLLIVALSPAVVLGGELVHRRHRLRPEPREFRSTGAMIRYYRRGRVVREFVTNPLWIALTAPARWLTDRLRPLAGGRRRRGNGPPGAGVREPRRPLPDLPAGAMALPEPRTFS
jgi:hypothetical protein